jgi:hypothetical protein
MGGGSDSLTIAGLDSSFHSILNLNGTGANQTVAINAFPTLASLDVNLTAPSSLTKLNGGPFNTVGSQNYHGPVELDAPTTISGVNVTFGSTINGNQSLEVKDSGATTFGGAVTIGSLSTDAPGSTVVNTASISTTGTQTYGDDVTLVVGTTLSSSGVGALGNIAFSKTIIGNVVLTVNTAGTTTFGGTVSIGSLTTDGLGSTVINTTNISTTHMQTYGDDVTLGVGTTLSSIGAGASGNIAFSKTVGGNFALTVNTAGTTTFGGAVSIGSLSTDETGSTVVNTSSISTTGTQTYGDDVTLFVGTKLSSSGAGVLGNIAFNKTIGGNFALTVNTAGTTTFGGAVSIGSLSTDAPGSTVINTASISTIGGQTYNDPVKIATDATLTTVTLGAVLFNGTLDDDGLVATTSNLVINSDGITTFAQAVGGISPLTSLAVTSGGPMNITKNITTANNLSLTVKESPLGDLNDDLTVETGATLLSNAANILLRVGDNLMLKASSHVKAPLGSLRFDIGFNDNELPANSHFGGRGELRGELVSAAGNQILAFGGSGNDTLTVYLDTVSLPLPQGLKFDGLGGADALVVEGTSADEIYLADDATGSIGRTTTWLPYNTPDAALANSDLKLQYANIENLRFNTNAGNDRVTFKMSASTAMTVQMDGGTGTNGFRVLGTTGNDVIVIGDIAPTGPFTFSKTLKEDFNNNGVLDPAEDVNGNGVLDASATFSLSVPQRFQINNVAILQLFGDAGNDLIVNNVGTKAGTTPVGALLDGGADNDTIIGGAATNVIFGGLGSDKMWGGAANDYIFADADFEYFKSPFPSYPYEVGPNSGDFMDGGAGTNKILSRGVDTINNGSYIAYSGGIIDVYSWLRGILATPTPAVVSALFNEVIVLPFMGFFPASPKLS